MGAVFRRLLALLRRDRLERDLDDELAFHLAMRQAEEVRRGVPLKDAEIATRRQFGSMLWMKERTRDAWTFQGLESLWQDVRFAGRTFAKDRLFSLVTVLVLALAIGATTAMFTMVNAMLFRGLPTADDRIVFLGTRDAHGREAGVSLLDFEYWKEAAGSFGGMTAYFDIALTVSDDVQAPDLRLGPYVSANVFRLLDVRPSLGRDFLPDEDRLGAPGTTVLAYEFWQSRYGGDPAVLGRTIRVNDRPAVIIGVMPEGFRFPFQSDLWVPLRHTGAPVAARNARTHSAFGRLRDGVTITQARAELEAIAARLAEEHPATNAGIQPVVERFSTRYQRPVQRLYLTLLGAVLLVLLVACANVANLLLARSARRSREVALRLSLGASRGRVVRQLMVESLLLASVAAGVGVAVAFMAIRVFAAQIPFKPYWVEWTPDGRVLAFLCVTAVVSGLLFGVAPALQVSHSDPNDVLKEDGRGLSGGVHGRRWTNGLLTAEFALTLMLLSGAGLMMRSFHALYQASLVIDASNVLAMTVRITGGRYPTQEHRKAFYRALEERIAVLGEVSAMTIASNLPFAGGYFRSLEIDGLPPRAGQAPPTVTYLTVGSRYFETLGLTLVRGRPFDDFSGRPGHEHAIVNQRFVDMFFPNEDPLGRSIRLSNTNVIAATLPWVTIVGVSPTVRQMSNADQPDSVVYLPFQGDAGFFAGILIRPRVEVAATMAAVRKELARIDPELPLYGVMPLEELMAFSRQDHRSVLNVIGIFAGFALILASVGMYGVTAYSVAQRTHEIGIRMAVGAEAAQVIWLFVRRAMTPLGIGLVVGTAGVYAFGRLINHLLVQTTVTDPLTLVAVASLVAGTAVAASIVPARRAARLDPLVALRCE